MTSEWPNNLDDNQTSHSVLCEENDFFLFPFRSSFSRRNRMALLVENSRFDWSSGVGVYFYLLSLFVSISHFDKYDFLHSSLAFIWYRWALMAFSLGCSYPKSLSSNACRLLDTEREVVRSRRLFSLTAAQGSRRCSRERRRNRNAKHRRSARICVRLALFWIRRECWMWWNHSQNWVTLLLNVRAAYICAVHDLCSPKSLINRERGNAGAERTLAQHSKRTSFSVARTLCICSLVGKEERHYAQEFTALWIHFPRSFCRFR